MEGEMGWDMKESEKTQFFGGGDIQQKGGAQNFRHEWEVFPNL